MESRKPFGKARTNWKKKDAAPVHEVGGAGPAAAPGADYILDYKLGYIVRHGSTGIGRTLDFQAFPLLAETGGGGLKTGGEGGIRTPDTVARMPHFECGAFNHSATSPIRALRRAGSPVLRRRNNMLPRARASVLRGDCGQSRRDFALDSISFLRQSQCDRPVVASRRGSLFWFRQIGLSRVSSALKTHPLLVQLQRSRPRGSPAQSRDEHGENDVRSHQDRRQTVQGRRRRTDYRHVARRRSGRQGHFRRRAGAVRRRDQPRRRAHRRRRQRRRPRSSSRRAARRSSPSRSAAARIRSASTATSRI